MIDTTPFLAQEACFCLLQGRITDIELCFDKQGGSYDSCTHFRRLLVIQIENVCSRVGSLFVQDAKAKCQKLIEDSSDMLFPDCFVLPKSSNVNFLTKTGRGALSLLCCLDQPLCLDWRTWRQRGWFLDVSNESESISMVRSVVDLLEILNRNNK